MAKKDDDYGAPQVAKIPSINDREVKAAHQRVVDAINRNDAMDLKDLELLERAQDPNGDRPGKSLGIGVYAEKNLTTPVTSDDPAVVQQIVDFVVARREKLNLMKDEEDRKPSEQIRDEVVNQGTTVIEALDAYKGRKPNFADVADGPVQTMQPRFDEARAAAQRAKLLREGAERAKDAAAIKSGPRTHYGRPGEPRDR